MAQSTHPRHNTKCKCGHLRRDHVDMFQRCDKCECPFFDGPILDLAVSPIVYGPYMGPHG